MQFFDNSLDEELDSILGSFKDKVVDKSHMSSFHLIADYWYCIVDVVRSWILFTGELRT